MTLRILVLAVLAALAVPGAARAEVVIGEGTPQVGRTHLVASSTTTSDVRIVEQVDGEDVEVGVTPTAGGGVEASVPWTCREARSFVAVAGDERTAPFTVMTPSCAKRIKISTLKDVEVGDDLRVSLVDRWHQGGLDVDVCAVRPDGTSDCRRLALPPTGYVVHTLYNATETGTWRFDATTGYGTVSHDVRVVRRRFRGGPTVMFTGDSMMLATRHILRRRLPERVRTVDDIYVGSGITRPFVIDWARLPARQVRVYRPDATIISLGMGDSRGLDGAPCCGEDWVAVYAARVRTIMRTYARRGRGAVVWLNLPFGQNPDLWPAQAAVNAAVARAAVGLTRVQTVDLRAVFSPDGAFHRYIFRAGRRTRVRSADGIHLTLAGARIASRLVLDRLRRLGVIG